MSRDEQRDVVVTRLFDAPLAEVWKAWSESENVQQWWGPTGFTCPLADLDFREGGTSLVSMRAPQEFDMPDLYNTWTYTKIVPQKRIEYTLNFCDEQGNKLTPDQLGMPAGVPEDGHHVVIFRDLGDNRTEMTVVEHGYTTDQAHNVSQMGLEQCLDKMAAIFAR